MLAVFLLSSVSFFRPRVELSYRSWFPVEGFASSLSARLNTVDRILFWIFSLDFYISRERILYYGLPSHLSSCFGGSTGHSARNCKALLWPFVLLSSPPHQPGNRRSIAYHDGHLLHHQLFHDLFSAGDWLGQSATLISSDR